MRRIGYVRRLDSGRAERPDAETEALRAAGCDEIRVEAEGPPGGDALGVLHSLLETIEVGDQLVVGRLEHLGPSGRAMLTALQRLDRRGAGLEIVRPALSSRGPGGAALRAALEAVAAIEPSAARPRRPAAAHEIRALQEAGVGPVEIARRLGVSRMTVWRKLKAAEGCEA